MLGNDKSKIKLRLAEASGQMVGTSLYKKTQSRYYLYVMYVIVLSVIVCAYLNGINAREMTRIVDVITE